MEPELLAKAEDLGRRLVVSEWCYAASAAIFCVCADSTAGLPCAVFTLLGLAMSALFVWGLFLIPIQKRHIARIRVEAATQAGREAADRARQADIDQRLQAQRQEIEQLRELQRLRASTPPQAIPPPVPLPPVAAIPAPPTALTAAQIEEQLQRLERRISGP